MPNDPYPTAMSATKLEIWNYIVENMPIDDTSLIKVPLNNLEYTSDLKAHIRRLKGLLTEIKLGNDDLKIYRIHLLLHEQIGQEFCLNHKNLKYFNNTCAALLQAHTKQSYQTNNNAS
jgi:hypothetical protein